MKKFLLTLAIAHLAFVVAHAQSINLFPDSSHTPFIYGVASGDPTADAVVIWTAITPSNPLQSETINWQVALDNTFQNVVQSGTISTSSTSDFTAKVDVGGLQPNTTYFYHFETGGAYSAIGTTYTAPQSSADSVTVAIISCSSLYSGYFNAYRQMANTPELRAIVHLGDYIYEFIDNEERVRVPQNFPASVNTLEEWRGIHKLYLLDPDLREARQKKPFILIWDNHDLNRSNPLNGAKAFYEWNPIRMPSTDTTRIWRKLSYGNLLDVVMIDMLTEVNQDTFASGNRKIMGNTQFDWLKSELKNSQATWKLMGSQKFFSPWDLGSLASSLPGSGLSQTWNGFSESRDSLLTFIKENSINNFVVASGDLHMSIWSDLALNPFDASLYDKPSGDGSLGIEVMGTSVSRGNLDESGVPLSFAQTLYNLTFNLNPHQQYVNLYDHGYTLLRFTPDSMTAFAYIAPILSLSNNLILEKVQSSIVNQNRWKRQQPSSVVNMSGPLKLGIYPNPAGDVINVVTDADFNEPMQCIITDMQGRIVAQRLLQYSRTAIETKAFSRGLYQVKIEHRGVNTVARFVLE